MLASQGSSCAYTSINRETIALLSSSYEYTVPSRDWMSQIKHRRLVRSDRTLVPDYSGLLAQRADMRKLLQDLHAQV